MDDDGALRDRIAAAAAESDQIGAALQRRRLMASLFGAQTAPPQIGRYRIDRTIGHGGMGVVYQAYDPQLDRRVALKRLHDARQPARLANEAKAMARVVHPNAVPVFDVGIAEGHVYVVMQYVAGVTLRTWLQRRPGRPAVVEAFVAAGHGLAAVHDAGLLHRDFKPDNVLISEDGRVQITDFGLAGPKSTVGAAPSRRTVATQHERDAARPTTMDAAGGTPAYMSPEQLRGEALDLRSDIYSFCVALHEALHGVRPSIPTPPTAPTDAKPSPARVHPADVAVPRWLDTVVRRGIRTHRDDRWSTMPLLLDALERRSRSVVARRGGLLAVAVGVAIAAWASPGQRPPTSPPADKRSRATAAINHDQNHDHALTLLLETADAQRAKGQYHNARDTLRRAYARAVEQPSPRMAVRAATELVFVQGRLLDAPERAEVWARYAEAHLAALPDAAVARAWLHRQQGLLRQLQGREAEAAEHFERALALQQQELDPDDPRIGHAWENLGTLAYERADYIASAQHYERALVILRRAYGPEHAAVAMVLDDLGNAEEELGEQVRAINRYREARRIREALPADHPARAVTWSNLANVALGDGDLDQAERLHRRALQFRQRVLGPTHPSVAVSMADVGGVMASRGDLTAAAALLEDARLLTEHTFGPTHRRTARILGELANVRAQQGQTAVALALAQRAHAIVDAALPADHPHVRRAKGRLDALQSPQRGDDLP